MILGYELPRVDGGRPMMFLYEVGVLESRRQRGIGRVLLEELERWCVARACMKMFVPTSASNTAALALYRAAGGVGGADPDSASFTWKW
jgi:ribosomal protein S18 acetylase RimI-like enzyme